VSDNELVLEGAMTIAKAESLHHQLETLLQEQSKICINAKAVERADTSIVQLFSSLCDTADNLNIEVQILASEGLRECTTLLGFGGLTERYV
jgi:anti-anti-sigma regulatory factor